MWYICSKFMIWRMLCRPSYRKLSSLRNHLPDVPVLALTATAVPKWVIASCLLQLYLQMTFWGCLPISCGLRRKVEGLKSVKGGGWRAKGVRPPNFPTWYGANFVKGRVGNHSPSKGVNWWSRVYTPLLIIQSLLWWMPLSFVTIGKCQTSFRRNYNISSGLECCLIFWNSNFFSLLTFAYFGHS